MLIIVVIIIIILLLSLYFKTSDNAVERLNNTRDTDETIDNYDYLDELLNQEYHEDQRNKKVNKNKGNEVNGIIKPYFIDKQFHEDYRDTITAFDHLLEYDKPKFNKACLPVTYTTVNKTEIKGLLKSFLKMLNNEVTNKVHNYVTVNDGFQNSMPNPTVKSGWEKQLEHLGIPGDLFKTKLKSKIKIIKVDKVEKVESDSQVKYTVFMIIQKLNVSDQMVVKISFVLDRTDLNIDRNFFKNNNDKAVDLNVTLDDVFVIGYMSNFSFGVNSDINNRTDFYTFEKTEETDILDQKEIFKQLKKKYNDRAIESNGLTIDVAPTQINELAETRLKQHNGLGFYDSLSGYY
jgi:hypothetical protein